MKTSRREFLKEGFWRVSATALLSTPIFALANRATSAVSSLPLVIVAKGMSPVENARKAIDALGGMEKFVKPGDRVLLKPNSITSSAPTTAQNTNPEVVLEVARLCRKAGASQILALSHDNPSTWRDNGIGEALSAHGGKFLPANSLSQYQRVRLPRGLILRETMVVKELLEYEVFINLPVAKHHAGSQLTLGMKNFMGLCWDRLALHNRDLHQCIADLVTVRKPDLTLIDATRILLTNGPSGPGQVREEWSVIASSDPVAADAFAATLFKQEPGNIRHIECAYNLGSGETNLNKIKIRMMG